MMFAEPDEIDAEFVSQDSFVDHVADNLRVGLGRPSLADCNVAECVETEFKSIFHSSIRCDTSWDLAIYRSY